MNDRITNKQLESLCDLINQRTNSPMGGWQRVGNANVANVGHYYIDGAYGGVSLVRMVTDGGGVRTIIERSSKRELFYLMHAFLKGMEAANNTNPRS